MTKQNALLKELVEIRDSYDGDVKQFVSFIKERRLPLVEAMKKYVEWLDQGHEGKRYSSATINRKLSAAKSRMRYAFKHSSSAESLQKKFQLEEILKKMKPKRVDTLGSAAEVALNIDEARKLIRETKDATIRSMVRFLVGTGVRISEMLSIEIQGIHPAGQVFVSIRVMGKGRRERTVHAQAKLIDHIRRQFNGQVYLFEHDGRPFSRISVTNRIKHESLRTIGKEVSASQLRRLWALIQIQRGKDVRAVAAKLGHAVRRSALPAGEEAGMEPHEEFLDVDEAR